MNPTNPTLPTLTDLLPPEDLERVNDWILHGSALHRIQQWIYEEFDLTVAFATVLEYRDRFLTQIMDLIAIPPLPRKSSKPAAAKSLPSPGVSTTTAPPSVIHNSDLINPNSLIPTASPAPAAPSPNPLDPPPADRAHESTPPPVIHNSTLINLTSLLSSLLARLHESRANVFVQLLNTLAQYRQHHLHRRQQDLRVIELEEEKAKAEREVQRQRDFNRPLTPEEARALIARMENLFGPGDPNYPIPPEYLPENSPARQYPYTPPPWPINMPVPAPTSSPPPNP